MVYISLIRLCFMLSIAIVASAVVDCIPLSDRSYSKLVVCLLTYLQGQHTWNFEHTPSRAESVSDILTGSARLRFEHVTPANVNDV